MKFPQRWLQDICGYRWTTFTFSCTYFLVILTKTSLVFGGFEFLVFFPFIIQFFISDLMLFLSPVCPNSRGNTVAFQLIDPPQLLTDLLINTILLFYITELVFWDFKKLTTRESGSSKIIHIVRFMKN